MINLLPPAERRGLLLEKRKKLTILLGNIGILSLICLALILLSLKFYILQDVRYHNNTLEAIELSYSTPSFSLLKEVAEKYNATLVKMNQFYQTESYMHESLATILRVSRPFGVSFTSVVVERVSASKTMKVTISGMANNRDGLLEFKKQLEGSDKIANVYFPPESWIKSTNIDFNVTFDVINEDKK